MAEFVAVLPDIRSLHNVGSIFRTADGAGFQKIYLCGITPEPFDRFGRVRQEIAKVALGAEKSMPWEYRRSVSALLRGLKKDGWTIYALEQSPRSIPIAKVHIKPKEKVALVLGREVEGISGSLLDKADKIIEIPMLGEKESLNVGIAFGIAAYFLAFSEKKI